MSKELPYYQFEPAEYLAGDIMICSLEAHGLFSIIKCIYWQKECRLNVRQILKRYDQQDLINELEEEKCIKIDCDGFITINFLLIQYEKLKQRKIKLSEAGRKGGLHKKEATLKPPLSDVKTTPKHIEEKRKEEKRKETKKDRFNSFWKLYPKKVAKEDCLKKWLKLSDSDIDKIAFTISQFIAYKPFEDYTHPNPKTYLNQKRWNDELPEPPKAELTNAERRKKNKDYMDEIERLRKTGGV